MKNIFSGIKIDKGTLLTAGSIILTAIATAVTNMDRQKKFDDKYDKMLDEKIEKVLSSRKSK